MLKNPFSFYDFLGYLFPGLILVIFLKTVYLVKGEITIASLLQAGISSSFSWEDAVQYTVLAYVSGHLVSYFSSLTVEPYLIWSYGYPSAFLLNERYERDFFETNHHIGKLYTIFWKVLVCIVILPLCLASLFFGKILRFRYYVLKPLDVSLRENINKKVDSLLVLLQLSERREGDDIHRILMHYNYEHYPNHVRKYDNYVALYGFLRSLSLLCSSILWFLVGVEIPTINFQAPVDWQAVFVLIAMFCITYLYYLGFIKFYRRFTLENFMSIVADKELRGNNSSGENG